MANDFERLITPDTQEKFAKSLGKFCMHGVRSGPRGRLADLSTNQYAARLSGQITGVHMEAYTFWTPRGSSGDILLRGSVALERDDNPGVMSDYFIRHIDPIGDAWEVERFTRPQPGAEPAVPDDEVDQIDLFAALEADEAYWTIVEESRDTTRKLGLATPSEGEGQELIELIESNLARLASLSAQRLKEAG